MKTAFIYMNKLNVVGRGAGYIASAIKNSNHKIKFIDLAYTSENKTIKLLKNFNYDILLISTITTYFPDTIRLIKEIKKIKNKPILVGGVHPTIIGKKLLKDYPEIDFLCIGEGESMIIDFLDKFKSNEIYDIPNLCYRKNNKIITNPIRPAEDLSKLPDFNWNFFKKNSIVEQNARRFLLVTATRGCPYNCSYCSNGVYLKHYGKDYLRKRSVEKVINELKYLKKKYKPNLFYFGDEMILFDKQYAAELFNQIKKEINLPYGCMVRVENVNQKIVDIFKKTGCLYVGIGVECGDEKFRKSVLNRHMSNNKIIEVFNMFKKANIFRTSFNMIGYPVNYDNELTLSTIKLNQKLNPDYSQVTIYYPFPGTKLYDICIEKNLIDYSKLQMTSEYHTSSVIKNVNLEFDIKEIEKKLNPNGLNFYDFKSKESILTKIIKYGVKVTPKKVRSIIKKTAPHKNLWVN
jgi:anaerobic magnesium-protoporphyrin IX monomethyl ester cyclase